MPNSAISPEVLSQRASQQPRDSDGRWAKSKPDELSIDSEHMPTIDDIVTSQEEDADHTEWEAHEIAEFLEENLPSNYHAWRSDLSGSRQMEEHGYTYDVEITTDLPRLCYDPVRLSDTEVSVFVESRPYGVLVTDYGAGLYYWEQTCPFVEGDPLRTQQELMLIEQICDNYEVSLHATEGMVSQRAPYQMQALCERMSEVPDAARRLAEAQEQIGNRIF